MTEQVMSPAGHITRQIGSSTFPAIGFGAMGISAFYDETESDEERFKVLDAVYASGCRFWDTANVYGDSEELIGKWLKHSGVPRSSIFLATKFGLQAAQPGLDSLVNGNPEYVRQAFNTSIERLGVDYVDLYYLYRTDPNVPIEKTVAAMAELVKEGKVRYLGLSECSANTLRRAHKVHPIAAVEVEYSPFTLDIEDEKIGLLKTARKLGVKIVAYAPLGRGLLTGQFRSPDDFEANDFRRKVPKYSKENFPRILELSDALAEIGRRHNATAGQVSLAWILSQGDDFIPIPGTKRIKYLKENMGAERVANELTVEEIAEIRKLADEMDRQMRGTARYPPEMAQVLFVETPELTN